MQSADYKREHNSHQALHMGDSTQAIAENHQGVMKSNSLPSSWQTKMKSSLEHRLADLLKSPRSEVEEVPYHVEDGFGVDESEGRIWLC